MKLIEACDGVLLPGSKADIDPAKYRAASDPKTAPRTQTRCTWTNCFFATPTAERKPILGICYGLQILNVYRAERFCNTSSRQ